MTKSFGPFFVVLSSVTSLRKQFIGFHKLMWKLLWNFYEHDLAPMRLLKTQVFEKKLSFKRKKNVAHFFS